MHGAPDTLKIWNHSKILGVEPQPGRTVYIYIYIYIYTYTHQWVPVDIYAVSALEALN